MGLYVGLSNVCVCVFMHVYQFPLRKKGGWGGGQLAWFLYQMVSKFACAPLTEFLKKKVLGYL